MKTTLKITLLVIILVLIVILLCNWVINKKSDSFIFNTTHNTPHSKAGLLLGTSKYLNNGNVNLYFKYRIEAAAELYKSGKIEYIVASGDNSSISNNEPLDMKNELIAHGVPDSVIYLDYAGFRTFDSVIRMAKIFGQTDFTIISQKFHNQRAVYIARQMGYNAYGYNAKDVSAYYGLKTNIREKLARVKVFIDLLTNKQPHFLGEPVRIGIDNPN